jgi:hypothetical protein
VNQDVEVNPELWLSGGYILDEAESCADLPTGIGDMGILQSLNGRLHDMIGTLVMLGVMA